MAANFAASLFAPKLFSAALFGAAQEPSAASGIRRLQLYKLQEESLIKAAAKSVAAKLVAEEKPRIEVSLPVKKVSKRLRKPTARRVTAGKAPVPFVLAPVRDVATAHEELKNLPAIAFGHIINLLYRQTVVVDLQHERHRRRRRKVAALLLMAA